MSPSFFTILSPSENNIYILKLKKKINDIILQNEIIFSYKDNDEIINFKSPLTGVIKTLSDPEISPGQTVATIIPGCPHPSLLKNICVVCGEEVSDLFDNKYIPLLHKNPELTVKEEHAITLSRADEQRLLNEKRLVLIVDLDHTLIHTTNENLPSNLKDVYHYILHNNQAIWYHTKLRPGTFRFLQNMSFLMSVFNLDEFFELHICTFGVRAYAHAIADIIDKEGKYFSHRILSRDEFFDPTSKTPNLKCLFPVNDAMVCIIDDREDVWNYTENLIHVKPYRFFDNGDINSPDLIAQLEINQNDTDKNYIDKSVEDDEIEIIDEKGGTGDIKLLIDQVVDQIDHVVTNKIDTEIEWPDHDDYLYYLEDILKRVHKQFFDKLAYNVMAYKNSPNGLSESKKMPSLKQIIPDIKKSVLSGSSIAFSGVFPKTIPLLQSKERRMALSLGAKVTADIIPNVTTHLIAAIKGTNKVHKARKLGIHVVTIDWLISCYERWEHTGEKLFPLPATAKENVRISSTTKSIKTKSITSKKNIDSNISFVPWKKLIAIDFDDGFKVKSHHSKTMHVSYEDKVVLVCKPGKTLPHSTLTRTKSLKNTTNYYYDKVTGKKVKRFNDDGDDDVIVLYDDNNNVSVDKTITSQCNSSTKNPGKSVVDLSGKLIVTNLSLKSNDSVMEDSLHSQEDESSLSHNQLKTMEQEIIDAINDEEHNSDMESSESCGTDKDIIDFTKEDTNPEFTTTPSVKRKEASS